MNRLNKKLIWILVSLIIVLILLVICFIWVVPTTNAGLVRRRNNANEIVNNEQIENTTEEPKITEEVQENSETSIPEENKLEENTVQVSEPAPVVTFTDVNETVYATTNVNIRVEPTVSSQSIGALTTGESVVRTGIGSNGWDRVTYNGQVRYINHTYLSLEKVAIPEPKAPEPIAQSTKQPQSTTQPTTQQAQTTNTKPAESSSNTQPTTQPVVTNTNNYLITNVPYVCQNPSYPNGCEAASTVMLLNYYGMNVSLSDFINNYLSKDKVYKVDGVRYGPNPETCYAGDPASPRGGWGCFTTAIENAVNKLINARYANKYTVRKNTSNASLPELAKSKKPFAVWTTITYNVVQGQYTWKSYDGKVTYTYPKDQHVIVIIGQDDNYYYVNDPLKGYGNTKIAKSTLERSFDSMGRKAIFIDYK